MISDQSHLANNSSKRDPLVVPYCRHCPAEKETAEHFLTSCPAYSLTRLLNLGSSTLTMYELIQDHKPKDVVNFIKKNG